MQTIAAEYVRENFPDLLNRIELGESFAIMERGEVRATLNPPEDNMFKSKGKVIDEFRKYIQNHGLRLDGLSMNELREEGRRS